jgi:hypothetical protein
VNDGPVFRDHTALKVTAGLTRVFAGLVAAIAVGVSINMASLMRGALPVTMPAYGFAPAVLVLIVGFFYAAIIWAGADVFIMLADSDDAHRRTQYELQQLRRDLAAVARSPRGADRETVKLPPIPGSTVAVDAPQDSSGRAPWT